MVGGTLWNFRHELLHFEISGMSYFDFGFEAPNEKCQEFIGPETKYFVEEFKFWRKNVFLAVRSK